MERRTLLKLMSLSPLMLNAPAVLAAKQQSVVVVGAGIVGASIAFHLAQAGCKVTVIDKQGPASHASRGTFAWINATYAKQPRSYHSLSQQAVAYWHQIQSELDIPVKWGGSIEWFEQQQRQQKLAEQIAQQQQWQEPAQMLSAVQAKTLEPLVDFQGAQQLAFSASDGAVDPVLATTLLLESAQKLGAKLITPCELLESQSINGTAGSVKLNTSCGELLADKLVLATGAATGVTKQFAGIDIPQRTTPGFITVTEPMPPLLKRILVAPGVHIHQRLDGRFVVGEQQGAPDNHKDRLTGRPNSYPNKILAEQHGKRILAIAEKYLPGIKDAKVEDVYIGWRPLPLDGHPVVGYSDTHPNSYIAIMHSGVTLAPLIGKLVSQEILSGQSLDLLDAYRPTRSFELIKRY